MNSKMSIIMMCLLFVFTVSCEDEKQLVNSQSNHEPVITGLWSNPGSPIYLYYNNSTTIYATADDEDGDELSFSWSGYSLYGDNFSGVGQSIYWQFPFSGPEVDVLNSHNLTIRLDVSDGKIEDPIREWIYIDVIGEGVDVVDKYPTYSLNTGMTYSLIPVIDFNDSRYGTVIFKYSLWHINESITPLYEETVSLGEGHHINYQLQGVRDFTIPTEWSGWDISIAVYMFQPNGMVDFSLAFSEPWHIN